MKTSKFSKLLALGALLCFFLLPVVESKAQPIAQQYKIDNFLRCGIKVSYTIFKKNPVPPNFCDVPCASGTIFIPAGSTVLIPAWPGYPSCGCGLEICVVDVNGSPTSICAGWPNPPHNPSNFGPDPTGGQCSPSGIIKVNVGPGSTQITP